MNKREPFRKVIVEWHDSVPGVHGWSLLDDEVSPAICTSIGFLIHQDELSIVIVPHATLGRGLDQMHCHGKMTIPACAIRRMHDLLVAPAGMVFDDGIYRGQGPTIEIKAKKKIRNRLRT